MRLTCPNCKAQYEVEESVIPEAGRDVQCSACGHTWYQYPINVALQMRAAELDEDDDEEGGEDDAGPPAPPPAQVRQVDRSVMDLLREEAERELRERRGAARSGAGAEAFEAQAELGLPVRPSRPATGSGASETRRGNAATGEAAPDASGSAVRGALRAETLHESVAVSDERALDQTARSRLDMLPDIDELSSTLEPRREPRRPAAAPAADPGDAVDERRGLLRGLSMAVIIGAVLLCLYLFAPAIAAQVPALENAMSGYVAMIDALRLLVAGWIDALRPAP